MIPEITAEFDKIRIAPLYDALFWERLQEALERKRDLFENPRGNILKYATALTSLPRATPCGCRLSDRTVGAGRASDMDGDLRAAMVSGLRQMCPWRKGPFDLFGIFIDAEWQSFRKWERLAPHIAPLQGRQILDIGASNGYYMFRMAAHAPALVVGLEPQHTFYFQYLALQKYLRLAQVAALPFTFDEFPVTENCFDTIFCMGVLYHRKSPLEMLKKIHDMLKKGGELVLENLVIPGDDPVCLFPEDRYAKMRNVFFIPTARTMTAWLERSGFSHVRCIDTAPTTSDEQRRTDWIQTESLDDFLDPEDSARTVEGYPAPLRAIFLAQA